MTFEDKPPSLAPRNETEKPGPNAKADGKGWRIQLESGELQEVDEGEDGGIAVSFFVEERES